MLLRQGSRPAGRLNTDWFAVHVETKQEAGHRIDSALQRHLLEDEQRARDLGAEVARLRSERPVEALLEFASAHGVRHIVGDIGVESDPQSGRGSQFWFTLPIAAR
jgi:two-component system sensor histidine kinase KdpD